jgi:hypothetical protein
LAPFFLDNSKVWLQYNKYSYDIALTDNLGIPFAYQF